ncbi:MAG TPA: hypothetical protein VHT91_26595, partial [Kofleriaceae bacterium]|nr:hypothetical protein [Kofleriaceae bacterium]
RMGVGAAPAESPPVLRGPREVRADKTRPIQITAAASDPILLAVAPGALALTSRDRASTSSARRPSEFALASRDRASTSSARRPGEFALAPGDLAPQFGGVSDTFARQ